MNENVGGRTIFMYNLEKHDPIIEGRFNLHIKVVFYVCNVLFDILVVVVNYQ